MKGAETLLALRLKGQRPVAVFLNDYAPSRLVRDWTVAAQLEFGVLAALHIHEDDPASTDLRFLQGVRVHLHSDQPNRAAAWVDALLEAGAATVIQSNRQGELYTWSL